jgi:uncharacterized protein YqkB
MLGRTFIDIPYMNKTQAREHLARVLTTKEFDGQPSRIVFADSYLGADQGTDEYAIQRAVSDAMHNSGLSFDFSYSIAGNATDILAELEDWNDEDALHEAIDSYVPIYYHDIAKIYLADWGTVDEWRDEIGATTPSDCMKDAQGAWYNEIQKMVQAIRSNVTEILEQYYRYNVDVCPSSLGEDDLPMDENETAHKWDDTTDPVTCSECGTTKDA